MACWSAENAIKAYLRTLKMGKRDEDQGLDIAEFISALAAGNSARLMVVACAGAADSTALALVAAAHQTGGRVVCILPRPDQLRLSKEALGSNASHVEFVIGEAQNLLSNDYLEADFAVIDCNLGNHEDIIRAMHAGRERKGSIVVGYNAFCSGSWQWSGMRVQLLPIGGGLLVTRIPANEKVKNGSSASGCGKSHWVVKVDRCTGEEHVFRVRSPHGKR
ncbi:hypothetical protein RHMOL_Rhmol09G0252500 [Rhododendron molle]|uniref:Uncharacterized protein n=1 Tax=Rhododendron molle TaxID=49168 RepID=A0ACC0MI62_RHOML|nr:hypothetical protein RHMOL_Rhmol09G0252500 [Rhododendron molle]